MAGFWSKNRGGWTQGRFSFPWKLFFATRNDLPSAHGERGKVCEFVWLVSIENEGVAIVQRQLGGFPFARCVLPPIFRWRICPIAPALVDRNIQGLQGLIHPPHLAVSPCGLRSSSASKTPPTRSALFDIKVLRGPREASRCGNSAQHIKEKPHLCRCDFSPDARSVQPDQSIKQPVQGLGAVHDHIGIRALHALGRCVEQ